LLMLTPLKNAASQLDRYFHLLAQMTYPKHRMSLAFLVGDETDDTYDRLIEHLYRVRSQYRRVIVLRKDFNYGLKNEERKTYMEQVPRRKTMARARNYLVTAALYDEEWVLWRDVDLVEFPADIAEQMMRHNRDVMTVNCYWPVPDKGPQPYDLNAWAETPESIAWAKTRDPGEPFFEGHSEMWTRRKHLYRFASEQDEVVRLDGVGGTFLLVRSEVHRSGALFSPFIYKHQLETEGFGLIANDMGYGVFGLPHLKVMHM
ncbi:hypothetical protein THASP1DRAFT_6863, partial [Thamnocephalis sphaerospora]